MSVCRAHGVDHGSLACPSEWKQEVLDARALHLAKAEHARMGQAMREHMPGHGQTIVTAWETMSRERRNVMVAVWRSLLDDGIVA